MRQIISRMTATLCLILLAATPAWGADMQALRQSHSIQITVESIDEATEIIRSLPGYNLDSAAGSDTWQRHARFRRRVNAEDFRLVQETLRSLGEVTFESENAAHLSARMMDLDVQIAVLDQELQRLTDMMMASATLDVLIAVNDRLTAVSRHRDSLVGQRNVLQVESRGPILNITLVENLPDAPRPVPPSFGRRITDRFMGSVQGTQRAAGNFAVGVARFTLPLIAWVAILTAAGFVFWRFIGRKIRTNIRSHTHHTPKGEAQ